MTGTSIQRPVQNGGVTIPTDSITLGNILAASGFFTDAKDAAQAAVKVMAGQELGFGPVASMTGIYIVKGRVTVSSNLMAAAIKRSGKYDYRVREHTAESCVIDFLQAGEVIGTSGYTMAEAAAAGLAGSDTYKKHPRNMLFARALSNGAKWYCPDIFGGPIYTPDELGQEIDGETGEVVNYTAPEPVAQVAPPAEPEPVDAEPVEDDEPVLPIGRNHARLLADAAKVAGVLGGELQRAAAYVRPDSEDVGDCSTLAKATKALEILTPHEAELVEKWLTKKATEQTEATS